MAVFTKVVLAAVAPRRSAALLLLVVLFLGAVELLVQPANLIEVRSELGRIDLLDIRQFDRRNVSRSRRFVCAVCWSSSVRLEA